MIEVSVSEVKAKLNELINKVEEGEEVTITRRGKPVVVVNLPLSPLPDLQGLRSNQPLLTSSADLIRKMRDETY